MDARGSLLLKSPHGEVEGQRHQHTPAQLVTDRGSPDAAADARPATRKASAGKQAARGSSTFSHHQSAWGRETGSEW